MKRTALYETHIQLGGRMVDFAGWELPVQYPPGPTKEHNAVRTAAGLFDIDHMGQFELTGSEAVAFLEYVQVANVATMGVYDAQYSLLTYVDGTIVDDIFIYKLPDRWLLVVNASNRSKDYFWLQSHIHHFNATIIDVSDTIYMLALQGPNAQTILQQLASADLSQVALRTAIEMDIGDVRILAGRTGYTGEDGFELYFPAASAVHVWETLVSVGAGYGMLPCGLGARDSLRFEACMPLYGHEIDASTNPIEARLGWVINFEHDFIGRSALLKSKLEGTNKRLVGLEMLDRAVPREGYTILSDGEPTGYVTSGMRSPTLGRFLAMGYVRSEDSAIGSLVDVLVRGEARRATVVKRPFYRRAAS